MLCRHCQRKKANRPRGLCWTCYYTPGLRDRFASTSKFARRGVGNFNGLPPLPDQPTDALPGSEEKIRVLIDRAAKRQALFHPADATGFVLSSASHRGKMPAATSALPVAS